MSEPNTVETIVAAVHAMAKRANSIASTPDLSPKQYAEGRKMLREALRTFATLCAIERANNVPELKSLATILASSGGMPS